MAKITRRDDAKSIVGDELADELEMRSRMVGKSDADEDELPQAMATKADVTRGGYMRDMRKKKKLSMADVAKALEITEARLKRLEDDEDEMDDEAMEMMAEVFKMSDKEKEDMLARFGKKRKEKPPVNEKADVDEGMETPAEKMDYGHDDERMVYVKPLGGATSIKQAEDYITQKEKMGKMYSYWDMMKAAYENINSGTMEPSDKVKATSNLFREMATKIDTLKAGLSDAYLIQQSAAAYEDEDDYEDADADYYIDEEDNEVIMTPEEKLLEARKAALENKSLTRQDQEMAIQKALTDYAQEVSSQIDAANPQPMGDQIAGAIEKAMAPLAEKLALLTAKMDQQGRPAQPGEQLQEVYVPQQKSFSAGHQPQPVQPNQGSAISPVLGKPSPLTDIIRKSVGLVT